MVRVGLKQFWNEALTERKLEKQVVWSAFEEETSHVTPTSRSPILIEVPTETSSLLSRLALLI